MNYKIYSVFLLCFCWQFTIVLGQEKESIVLESDTTTLFHWGAVTVPLANITTRRTKGKITAPKPLPPTVISINELIISLKERIFLYKDQQISPDFQDLSLSFSPSYETVQKLVKRGIPAKEAQESLQQKRYTLKLAANESKELTETVIQKITSIIDHDTRIAIIVNKGRMMGQLIVKATYAPYEPPAIVKHIAFELFKFQLLEPLEGPTILRIDTNENRRVFDMYKADGKTNIIHLPNFQTATRTASQKEESNLTKILKQASSYPTPKALHLLEYVAYAPKDLTLRFGELIASPESQNYALATFLNKQGKLILQHKAATLKIKSFRLTIYDKAENATTHWIKISKKNKWITHLNNLNHENSIYFDKIIIEKDKQSFYLGQAFLFKVGKAFLKK